MALAIDDRGLSAEDLYNEFGGRVHAYVRRRIRDRQLAEDVVQETFLRAHRARSSLDPTRPAWPWLASIAANLCRDATARASFRTERPAEAPGRDIAAPPTSDPEEQLFATARREVIGTALRSLPARQRRILLLREVDALSYDELAEQEDLSADAVKSLLKRARHRFRELYTTSAERAGLLGGLGGLVRMRDRLRARAPRPILAAPQWSGVIPVEALAALLTVGTLAVGGWAGIGPDPVGAAGHRPDRPTARILHVSPPAAASARAREHTRPAPSDDQRAEDSRTFRVPASAGEIEVGAQTSVETDDRLTITNRVFAKVPGEETFYRDVEADLSCIKNEIRRIACETIDRVPDAEE